MLIKTGSFILITVALKYSVDKVQSVISLIYIERSDKISLCNSISNHLAVKLDCGLINKTVN